MASYFYVKTVEKLLEASPAIDWDADTFKVGLSTTVHVPSKTADAFLDDGGADDFIDGELSGTGYVAGFGNSGRKALVSRTSGISGSDVQLDAADLTWTTLYSVTVAQATLLKEVTNDAASLLIINMDFADVNPNTNDFTLQFAATGLGYASCV